MLDTIPSDKDTSKPSRPHTYATDSDRTDVKARAGDTASKFGTKPAARGINAAQAGAGSYPISRTDLPTHTASPMSCTPFTQPLHQDTDVPQYSLNEKCQQIDPASR